MLAAENNVLCSLDYELLQTSSLLADEKVYLHVYQLLATEMNAVYQVIKILTLTFLQVLCSQGPS